MDMDKYVRKQAILAGLTLNLRDLYKERKEMETTLEMLNAIIRKHESYLELLEADDD